jgi:hypothetical protein
MHRYQDALFMQTEHLRFLRTGTGVRYYEAFERAMRQEEYEGDDYAELPEGLTYAVMQRICERGEPAYIASQIIDTINDALPTFEPEPLLPTDMFTAEGFAYFPRPVFKVQSITSGGELIESEADSAHYSVQFPVRGHWHTYHYKAVGPRQVWVDSYWKGPEDAPVQNSRRVFEVTR